MIKEYKCKNCQWEGDLSQLEYDEVEGCFGNDKVEICPDCGSYAVYSILSLNEDPKGIQ